MNTYLNLIEATLLLLEENALCSTHLLSSKELSEWFTTQERETKAPSLLRPERRSAPSVTLPSLSPKPPAKVSEALTEKRAEPKINSPLPPLPEVKTETKPSPPSIKNEIKKLIERVHPHFKLSFELPTDEKAIQIAEAWKEQEKIAPIMLLSFAENAKEEEFFHQVAQAITAHLLPAGVANGRLLEKEKKWETFLSSPSLKGVISTQFPKAFYRENLATSEKFLKDVPLILISAPSFYFKNPEAKRALWKTLCATLRSS